MSPDEIEWIMRQSTWSLEVEGQHPATPSVPKSYTSPITNIFFFMLLQISFN